MSNSQIYEIEIVADDYYGSTIIEGPGGLPTTSPIPQSVIDHARLLTMANTPSGEGQVKIGFHRLMTVDDDGQKVPAATFWALVTEFVKCR